MHKKGIVFIVIGLVLISLGLIIKTKFLDRPGLAAITVLSTPKAAVYLDGQQVGLTTYSNEKIKAGEHTVKLVPESGAVTWEGKVNLTSNVVTIVDRILGATEAQSAGELVWLEKGTDKKKALLSVISIPDQSVVKIDNQPKGFTPLAVDDLNAGSYQLTISSPGYEEKTISIKTVTGYKMIINTQLVKKIEGIAEASSSAEIETTITPTGSVTPKVTPKVQPTVPDKPYVTIKETPTGWLRVREEAKSDATELTKVNPGEMYPYLNESKDGWFKIEYEAGKEGWISGVYADLVK